MVSASAERHIRRLRAGAVSARDWRRARSRTATLAGMVVSGQGEVHEIEAVGCGR